MRTDELAARLHARAEHLAGQHCADARRRARQNEIARAERHDGRHARNEARHAKDEVARVARLHELAINLGAGGQEISMRAMVIQYTGVADLVGAAVISEKIDTSAAASQSQAETAP